MRLNKLAAAAAVAFAVVAAPAQAITSVDLELALLIDVSGSVSAAEFDLQRQGYVNAFQDASIQAAIASGHSVAAKVVYWAAGQQTAVDWTLITDAASANSFAAAILAAGRPFSGSTGPGSAINFAAPTFFTNAFDGKRKIIDVSGDGAQNVGANTAAARDAALLSGIDQINGLPILGEAGLEAWYNANIKGGTGAFVTAASGFDTFDAAVKLKIGREITGNLPEPSTYAMMGLGLAMVGFLARRRKTEA